MLLLKSISASSQTVIQMSYSEPQTVQVTAPHCNWTPAFALGLARSFASALAWSLRRLAAGASDQSTGSIFAAGVTPVVVIGGISPAVPAVAAITVALVLSAGAVPNDVCLILPTISKATALQAPDSSNHRMTCPSIGPCLCGAE